MKNLFYCATFFGLLVPASLAEEKKRTGIFKMIDEKRKRGHLVQAMNNAKQLFLLMVEFDQDFGSFPSDATAKEDADMKGYTGKNSNDYLGQLIAGGYIQSEEIFYVLGASKTQKKPDNDFTTKAKTLEAGECGFTYVSGQSSSGNSARPLLCAPMSGKGTKFDSKALGGRAIVLRIDGSVKNYEIDENGDVVLPNGKKLFENGAGTVWGKDGFKQEMLLFPK